MMIAPLITYRGMKESDALSALIRMKVAKLLRFYGDIHTCRVLVEQPHHHQRSGEHFHVRIELSLTGGEVVVEREPPQRSRHEDAYVAVTDAFRAARRELQDFVQRRRGFVKTHVTQEGGTP